MVQQHQSLGWLWNVRFNQIQEQQKKISSIGNTNEYYTANTQQREDQSNNTITLKDALEHIQEEHLLVNKIADAIVDNELGSNSQRDYSTDQLAHAIKEKYYPSANDNQINSVLSNLADRFDRVATITNQPSPDLQVTMWQSRNRYNYLHGISDYNGESSWYRHRPRI